MRVGLVTATVALGWLSSVNGAHNRSIGPKKTTGKPQTAKEAAVKSEVREIGSRLLARLQRGTVTLVNRERDLPQFKALAGQGCMCDEGGRPVSISLRLLRTLDRLSAKATKQHPFEVLSLYRPPRAGRTAEPHANGLAADVAQLQGRRIDSRSPREAEAGVIALLDTLGPGEYRLGLPKPPGTDPLPFAPAPSRPRSWPFLPAPLAVAIPIWSPGLGVSIVLPRPDSRPGEWKPWVARWENERGAPLSRVGSAAVRTAVRRAAKRGALVYVVFPDAADHVHIDVAPPPGEAKGPAITFDCCGD